MKICGWDVETHSPQKKRKNGGGGERGRRREGVYVIRVCLCCVGDPVCVHDDAITETADRPALGDEVAEMVEVEDIGWEAGRVEDILCMT